jgi:ABC-2 type transport system ATP-binding protein
MLEARSLTKRYGATVAVDDLSFTVRPGKVTGFLGPNGAGKSTTMRMVLGLDRPTAGTVLIDGGPYSALKNPLRTIGALIDAKWVHPNRSARAHLNWLARSNRIPRERVDEVLEMVGLQQVAKRRAGGFSLGMSQRLGIAAALLGDPQILMFDEPLNGLDPEGIHWIRQLMRNLAAEGRTVFLSSHLLSEMAHTVDELVVIGRGRLIRQCSTEEFVAGTGTVAVKVRSPQADKLQELVTARGLGVTAAQDNALLVDDATTEQIGEIAAENGIVLHELSSRQGSLEEAFMQVTGQATEYQTTDAAVAAAGSAAQ